MKNCITIQLKKDEIWLKIIEDAEHREIIEELKKKIDDLAKLYRNEKTPIIVKGKLLKNREIKEIEDLIKSKINVKIEFESPKTLGLYGIKKIFNQEIKSSETKFQKGTMRSGQKIEFEGSVVVLGDVKTGAEIIAAENIVILGELKGLAHAGAKGNSDAIIAANKIECPQIRIADKIREFEKEDFVGITYRYVFIDENEKLVIK